MEMTATIILIRHGMHDLVDIALPGRMEGVGLNATGHWQAQQLASILAEREIAALYASPMQRAIETAQPIAEQIGKDLRISASFNEIDIGAWTGKPLNELREDADWQQWNAQRSFVRCPGGESFNEVSCRVANELSTLAEKYSGECIAIVSHSDVIKAAVFHYLGISADFHNRLEISPASRTTIAIGEWGSRVITVNEKLR